MTHRPHYNDRTDVRLFQYSCKVVVDFAWQQSPSIRVFHINSTNIIQVNSTTIIATILSS